MPGLDDLWKKILAEVELEVSRGQFLMLFKATSLISLENNVATIGTRDAMMMNFLQSRYSTVIKQAFAKHGHQNIGLAFVLKTNIAKDAKKEEEIAGPLFETPKPQPRNLPRVRQDYTFATLAVSGSNQLAVASAQKVAEDLGKSYNPLFIYGPVGVGKTHL